ncbi:hypothetical protein VOLCADRAFT_106775 [Volvox carteri f. nagariensis]|uniref:Glucokinase n=1 Tax=Volvox carteri f. nagariensis TaxID=3068 RepID=D8U9P2_VOLCA|nr:uncharacterized protein VOLCADRAFT_106775 [Volvox carteri f. nagariensis]EFJ43507.1 hypothetical protein VOLCADRAFT_106775 [Volvox carteri f. nagariensis]|eukprot:XP_002955436.1 hypothetical protein VOLCADRAFT_106775 [Volvox carteri f. nagariensis]
MAVPILSSHLPQHPCSTRKAYLKRGVVSRRIAVARAENKASEAVVLVGDIGGTNARLSAWRTVLGSTAATQLFAKVYPTSEYSTFDAVVDAFLSEPSVGQSPPQAAALAIAGAVNDNRCNMTNVNWIVDGDQLQAKHGFRSPIRGSPFVSAPPRTTIELSDLSQRIHAGIILCVAPKLHVRISVCNCVVQEAPGGDEEEVALLNDFEAVGYGIPALEPKDMVALNETPVAPWGPKVVMGPGTGLGAAQLMWDSGIQAYKVWPGEGSHATFAPRGWKQEALSRYVTNMHGHCEIEQVACGRGLELIYEFLLTDEAANRPELLAGTKLKNKKKAAEISAAALEGSDPIAVEAVDMMFAIVGAEAGAMALRCLAKGGVYIAGGITPKLLPRVKAGALLEGFLMRKGRAPFHKILIEIPLFVITNEQVGQIGAREVAKRLLAGK